VALLMLVSLGITRAEDRPHDGYWWNQTSDESKVWYIAGYAEALAHATDQAILKCVIDKNGGKEPRPGTNEMFIYGRCPTKIDDFTGIRFSQLRDGVNEFYKDFRNTPININFALAYVKEQLRGTKSAKQQEEDLAGYRRKAAK